MTVQRAEGPVLSGLARSSILFLVVFIATPIRTQSGTGQVSGTPFGNRTFTYKTVGNCALQVDVYRPPEDTIRPLILWIHGGALIGGYRGDISMYQLKRYIQAGFAVASVDYRLAPETKLPQILEDV